MKSFMAAVRHFSLSSSAVICVDTLLSNWREGSLRIADNERQCASAVIQTGFTPLF